MTIGRYFQWMQVLHWFAAREGSGELAALYDSLNTIWQDEREKATPEELKSYAALWALEQNFLN
jgi:hypothetical protein